jgi:hypothetical protein
MIFTYFFLNLSNELVQLMTSIGNNMLNSVYEANTKNFAKSKPNPNSSR